MAEADNDWTGLTEPWQRLVWARERRFPSQAAFARKIGMRPNTYGFHERDPAEYAKATDLSYDKAVEWAPVLEVRWEWLLNRQGEPWPDTGPVTPRARILRAVDRVSDPAEQARLADAIEALTGTGG